ncbi:hypothetical protein [Dactylosporangium sp. CA-233914]|uniref:hypothetical protein n=1 Tax=Dactylosporangium sp. CA-233914 TaxID=3239934 RepID=UPI003D8C2ED0
MRAELRRAPAAEHRDPAGIADRRQAVRHHERDRLTFFDSLPRGPDGIDGPAHAVHGLLLQPRAPGDRHSSTKALDPSPELLVARTRPAAHHRHQPPPRRREQAKCRTHRPARGKAHLARRAGPGK